MEKFEPVEIVRDDSTARGRNLLIVDDEIAVLEIMRETLVSAGYKVAAAASARKLSRARRPITSTRRSSIKRRRELTVPK